MVVYTAIVAVIGQHPPETKRWTITDTEAVIF